MSERIAKKLIYIILLTPLVYLPGVVAYAEVGSKVTFFSLLVGVSLSLLAFLFLFKKEEVKVGPVVWITGLYTAVLALSTIFAVNFTDSFWGGAKDMNGLFLYLCLFAFLILTAVVLKDEEDWDRALTVSVGAGAVVAFVAYLQIFNLISLPEKASLIGNSSFLGSYLIFNVFFALYLFCKRKDYLYVALMVLMTLPLYFFASRAGLGAILGGLILFGLLWISFKSEKEKTKKVGKIILVGSTALVVFVSFLVFHPVDGGLFNEEVGKIENKLRTSFYDASDGLRYIFWEQSVESFKEKPLLGWGLNSFQDVFLEYFNPEVLVEKQEIINTVGSPHNVVYEKLSAVGMFGLFAHLILLVSIPTLLWRSYIKGRVEFYAPAVFTAMITAYFFQLLTVYDTYNNLILLFLSLGFVNFYSFDKTLKLKRKLSLFVSVFLMIIVLFLSFFVVYNGFYKPVRANSFLVEALIETEVERKTALSKEAIRLSDVDRRNTRLVLAKESREQIYEGVVNQKESYLMIVFFLEELEKEDFNNDWLVLMEKGQYHLLLWEYEEAEECFKRAEELIPTNPRSLWFLAQIKVAEEKYEEAEEIIERFVKIEPRINYSQLLAKELLKRMENKKSKIRNN
jgi:O-antigen ligase